MTETLPPNPTNLDNTGDNYTQTMQAFVGVMSDEELAHWEKEAAEFVEFNRHDYEELLEIIRAEQAARKSRVQT